MPKIIENIRGKLLEEAKIQVQKQGYSAMTIRSVASACGVGTGTVYNYFSSKDMLVASFLLEDWRLCIEKIEQRMKMRPRVILLVQCKDIICYVNSLPRC